MGTYIDLVKKKLKVLLEDLKKIYSGMTVRFGVVGYRDIRSKSRFEILKFQTENSEEVTSFLNNMKAVDGEDLCEDVNGGF